MIAGAPVHADQHHAVPSGQMEMAQKFLQEIWSIADTTKEDRASVILTLAQMRIAARLLPRSNADEMGFLDLEREITAPDWQAMLRRLPAVWPKHWPAPRATFLWESQSAEPGHLERLRRLVLSADPPHGAAVDAASSPHRRIGRSLLAAVNHRFGGVAATSPDLGEFVADVTTSAEVRHVYCAYGMAADVAIHIAEAGGVQVMLDVENTQLAALCACIAVTDDLPLIVRELDPLSALTPADQGLPAPRDTYDAAIVFPPWGTHGDRTYQSFGTKLPPPGAAEGQFIALALARSRRLAMCLPPPSFLFRTTKADQAFKEQAIRRYGLAAVISLPREWTPWPSSIPASMLIFRPQPRTHPWMHRQPHVPMIDARREREGLLSPHATRSPSALADILRDRAETGISVLASADEIAGHDFNLTVERYVLDPGARRIRDLLLASETVPLEDVAEISRPQALFAGRQRPGRQAPPLVGSTTTLLEVGVADIDDVGVVRTPTTSVPACDELLQRTRRARLEPGDVLIVIKGSVGKVGFVRDIPDGPAWLASQSFAILRLRRRSPLIDPAILFRFLSSAIGQVTVQSLKVGSVISGLQMADLRRLPVLVPSVARQKAIAEQMRAIFDMRDAIQQKRRELAEWQDSLWPLTVHDPADKPDQPR